MEIISSSSLRCVLLLFKWFSLHIRRGLNWLRVIQLMYDLESWDSTLRGATGHDFLIFFWFLSNFYIFGKKSPKIFENIKFFWLQLAPQLRNCLRVWFLRNFCFSSNFPIFVMKLTKISTNIKFLWRPQLAPQSRNVQSENLQPQPLIWMPHASLIAFMGQTAFSVVLINLLAT